MSCKITYYGKTIDRIHTITAKRVGGIGVILSVIGGILLGLSIPHRAFDISRLPKGLILLDPIAPVKAYEKDTRPTIPSTIQRYNRRTGKLETVTVPADIARVICSKDWPCEQALKVVFAESSFNQRAIYKNKDGSRDRGIWQISEKWHPEVSNACAFNLECSTDYAYKLFSYNGWASWHGARSVGL